MELEKLRKSRTQLQRAAYGKKPGLGPRKYRAFLKIATRALKAKRIQVAHKYLDRARDIARWFPPDYVFPVTRPPGWQARLVTDNGWRCAICLICHTGVHRDAGVVYRNQEGAAMITLCLRHPIPRRYSPSTPFTPPGALPPRDASRGRAIRV